MLMPLFLYFTRLSAKSGSACSKPPHLQNCNAGKFVDDQRDEWDSGIDAQLQVQNERGMPMT
jgi:hypothetical protein